jgi:lipoprotein-releasing system permease protein
MTIQRSIAMRYLRSKRQVGFVTVISIISIVGVTIGVAALIVVLSVFNGFNGLVTSILISFDPHLRIEHAERADTTRYRDVLAFLNENTDVSGVSPYVEGKALVVSRNVNRVLNVKGIDIERFGGVSGLGEKIVLGSLDVGKERQPGIVIGLTLADRLGAVVGDTISVVSPSGSELALLQAGQPLIRRFVVKGVFESDNKEYDAYYAYVGLPAAQRLFERENRIDGVEVRLKNIGNTDEMKQLLLKQFGSGFRILTWYDFHRELYSVMQIERWMAFVILSLIIGVASFNLLGSLTMSVIEKTRDIGILKTIGATREMIQSIFLHQGFYVGVVGAVLGLVLGVGLVLLQQQYHLIPLDPTVYIIPAIPVELHPADLFLVPLTAIVLCSIAALYPARRASNLAPVEAIRWE